MHFMDPKALAGLRVIGSSSVKLGVVEGVYADIRNGQPQWAAVRSGLFGADVSLIPLAKAECDDGSLRIPYTAQQVREAPHRVSGTVMSHKEEANLFRHYGISHGTAGPSAGKAVSRGAGRTMLHRCHAAAVNHGLTQMAAGELSGVLAPDWHEPTRLAPDPGALAQVRPQRSWLSLTAGHRVPPRPPQRPR